MLLTAVWLQRSKKEPFNIAGVKAYTIKQYTWEIKILKPHIDCFTCIRDHQGKTLLMMPNTGETVYIEFETFNLWHLIVAIW